MLIIQIFFNMTNLLTFKTRMHSSRIRTARSSSCHEGLPQCMLGYTPLVVGLETPQVWAWRPPIQTPQLPPWVWAWRPPTLARPLNIPPEYGSGNIQGMLGYHHPPPPGDLLQGMLGYHLQCMLGYHPAPPSMNRITDTCKNITLPQLRCGR